MHKSPLDVVVVGAGIMGSAAAWQLAARGHRVAVCEQYELDHQYGSSHGRSRIFRLAYDIPEYVQLAREALEGWLALEEESGRQLLWQTGGMDLGSSDSLGPIAGALKSSNVSFDWLDQSAKQLTGFCLPPSWGALHQPDAGVLQARSCLQAFQTRAELNNAKIMPETAVIALEDRGHMVAVRTSRGSFEVRCVVVTSAGWSNRLLSPVGIDVPLRVTRENVAYYRTQAGIGFVPFIWHPGDGHVEHYGLPGVDEAYVKLGEHGSGREVVPGSTGEPDNARIGELNQFVRTYTPGLIDTPCVMETCLYASTPDDDFVIDRVGSIVIGLGFGGHGFKFAPIIGEMLADLVDEKQIPHAQRFSRNRFGDE